MAADLIPGFGFQLEYRELAYDMSIGIFVSYVFYLLIVALPDLVRRRRIARLLRSQFETFKLACIAVYLSAIGDGWDSELPKQLLKPDKFRDYFSARFSPSQNRWHAVHNGLYEYGLPQLLLECEIFAREIEFALTKLEDVDDDLLSFLKRMSRALVRLKTSTLNYDDIKALLNFLYPIHSHWSWLDGEAGKDPVGDAIDRL